MSAKPLTGPWVKALLDEQGKLQADLVQFLAERGLPIGADKMSKVVAGKRKIQRDEAALVWEFFGQDPAALADALTGRSGTPSAGRLPMPNAGLPERIRFDAQRLPILGRAVAGDQEGRALFNGQIFGLVSRPESLADVPDAYGAYVHGDSMLDRYEAGEVVLVNPHKGYKQGNYVVAQVYDNDGDPPFGYVKRFVSFGSKELVLEQLNPPEGSDRLMRFPRKQVLSVHRIVGTLDE